MEIKYLCHSGAAVSYDDTLLIFDYYKKGISKEDITGYDNIFVFVSHDHRDHFDRKIFEWEKWNENVEYIISSDTGMKEKENIHIMKPHEEYKSGELTVSTLDSTDEGVAFVVQTPDGTVFHAGDLNWWHWEGEPDDYNEEMAVKFKEEIDRIKDELIDIAFIPVDKRLEYSQYYSIDYLMEASDVRRVCPIHFMDDWGYIEKVKEDLKDREYYNKIYFYGT